MYFLMFISILISILLFIFNKYYYNIFLGKMGEYWTKQQLKKLPNDEYTVINDIYLKVGEKICQIDHIVVSMYGIFVIETKQYNGIITGSKYDAKWVRHIGNEEIYYSNPIRQNYGHVKLLCELLNLDENQVFNIVCIPSGAKLKINHDGELVRYYNILEKILSYKEKILFNINEIIYNIENNNIKDKDKRKEYVQKLKNSNKNLIQLNKCPFCGSNLIKKNGKFGKFIGCTNYPRCKYTRNIKKGR